MLASKLQQDCDKYDIGIDIISIRVTKPTVPHSIANTFVQQSLILKREQQNLIEAESKIVLQRARAEAEKQQQVRKIQLEVQLIFRRLPVR